MHILNAISDPKVFGQHFKGKSWETWKVFLASLFALTMSDAQLEIYKQSRDEAQHHGRQYVKAGWCVVDDLASLSSLRPSPSSSLSSKIGDRF
jgi:hypothetical protein